MAQGIGILEKLAGQARGALGPVLLRTQLNAHAPLVLVDAAPEPAPPERRDPWEPGWKPPPKPAPGPGEPSAGALPRTVARWLKPELTLHTAVGPPVVLAPYGHPTEDYGPLAMKTAAGALFVWKATWWLGLSTSTRIGAVLAAVAIAAIQARPGEGEVGV